MTSLTFSLDLITFFDPAYWGVPDAPSVGALARTDPRAFWDRILDELGSSPVRGIELTFAPFDWRGTLEAYGSPGGFADALAARGLHLSTGFFSNIAVGAPVTDPGQADAYIAEAELYADYLVAMNAPVMVMGLPMRKSWDASPPQFVDITYASVIADFCNRLGAAIQRCGARLALHNEAHSTFSTSRDVDLFMMLTDPVYVGFCPDTAHLVLEGADPVAVVDRHRDRVCATHWKDAVGAFPTQQPIDGNIHKAHRPYFRALGAGSIDWSAWIGLMRDIGFTGPAIIEIDAVQNPRAAIQSSMDYITTSLLPIIDNRAGAQGE